MRNYQVLLDFLNAPYRLRIAKKSINGENGRVSQITKSANSLKSANEFENRLNS